MLLMNAFMIHYYVQALNISGTMVGTLVNTAVNLLCSSLFGWLLFDESLSLQWWIGASFMATGIYCIQRVSTDGKDEERTKKE
mmetsp:Transcript_13745/g.29735  ORF Transcript_13745/g.29735 Transcript_13745/m.29735 type:complete len:83 (+) Transcript_13745:123-371(+)